jgi:hypothetical protein
MDLPVPATCAMHQKHRRSRSPPVVVVDRSRHVFGHDGLLAIAPPLLQRILSTQVELRGRHRRRTQRGRPTWDRARSICGRFPDGASEPLRRHNRCSAMTHGKRQGYGCDSEETQDRSREASGDHGGWHCRGRGSAWGGGRRIPWQAHLSGFRGDDDTCPGVHQQREGAIAVAVVAPGSISSRRG